jgi:hypothetical protein
MNIPDASVLRAQIDSQGYATFPLLDAATRAATAALYGRDLFRKRIVMEQRAYGRGEYKYFADPLPAPIAALRSALYPPLAEIANEWATLLGEQRDFPPTLDAFLRRCHAAGQTRPTPLMLRYEAGGFNCLHQDLYGPLVFPLQVVTLLSDPETDFTGGEFVLVEQRPRAQSRAEVISLAAGEACVFPVHHRPAMGARRPYRATMRHGVARVRSGHRQTLGLIFHDAE